MEPATVAVIGLGKQVSMTLEMTSSTASLIHYFSGALGLVTVKNLAEEGFAVTGFDRNEFVGGLWHYTDDDRTSALKCKNSSPEGGLNLGAVGQKLMERQQQS